jgi:alpha-tubulin suppressor-like RCC1 family protein/plastocyanin
MSQTKAQLIQPIGIVTAGGVVVTGVVTASSFDGDVVGTATSIISGGNLNLGDVNATTFSGDFTGNATGIITGAAIKVGSFTATSFTGDFTGTATSMMRGTGFKAGAVNATGFHVSGTSAGTIAGNVTGDVTGDVTGVSTGNVTGNVTGNITGYAKSVTSGNNIHVGVLTAITLSGDGSNLTGIAATNFNTQTVRTVSGSSFSINVTSPAGGNYTLSGTDRNGTVSGSSDPAVTIEVGDTVNFVVDASGHPFYIRVSDGGANVTTPGALNQGATDGTVSWTPNTAGTYYYQCGNHAGMLGTITVTATRTIDLSAGNMITFNQTSSTTVAFANTETAMDVTLIRKSPTLFTSGAVTFDGSNDELRLGESNDYAFGTGDFTIEGFYNQVAVANEGIFQITSSAGPSSSSSTIWFGPDSYNSTDWFLNVAGSQTRTTGSQGLTGNTWYHFAIVREDGKTRLYINGVLKTFTTGDTFITDTTNYDYDYLNIGVYYSSSYRWNGSISNFRIVKGTAVYTGAFTPPLEPLRNITNTTVLCCQSTSSATAATVSPVTITATGSPTASSQIIDLGLTYAARSLTWPSSVKWDGAAAPTLLTGDDSDDAQQFQFITRDSGLTWYAWEPYSFDAPYYELYSWGSNQQGALGLNQQGGTAARSSPMQIGTGVDWRNGVGSGSVGHMGGGTKTDGTLWVWGQNYRGNLGQNQAPGDVGAISSPAQVPGITWSANFYTGSPGKPCLAVKTDGTLWGWGQNTVGELAQNNETNRSSPVQVGTNTTWSTAADTLTSAEENRVHAIKTNGTLWSWGIGGYGELGMNGPSNIRYSSPAQVGTDTTWSNVNCGPQLTMAVKTDNTLWSWGIGNPGWLGKNDRTSRSSPVQIPGTTWATGENKIAVSALCGLAIKTDGTLWAWGGRYIGMLAQNGAKGGTAYGSGAGVSSPTQIPGTTWSQIAVQGYQANALKTDGTLWAWGYGDNGGIGNDSNAHQSSPVQIPGTWNTINSSQYSNFATKSI